MAYGTEPHSVVTENLDVAPLGLDDFSSLRYLHTAALRAQTTQVLSDAEIAAFTRLVNSPAYAELLLQEEVYGGWLYGELVGTVSWQAGADSGATARIGSVFVRHPRLGIGRQLLAAIEARAHQYGFSQFAAGVTANAVPFFVRHGYRVASRGVKTLSPECALPVTFLKKVVARRRFAPPTALN
jgi:GNAT superfamily N-acetyltransferase